MPIFELPEEIIFPKTEFAEPDGLLAIGGDLTPLRLLTAYSLGIFPGLMKIIPYCGGRSTLVCCVSLTKSNFLKA